MCKESLPTRQNLVKRGIISSGCCAFCVSFEEDCYKVLCGCSCVESICNLGRSMPPRFYIFLHSIIDLWILREFNAGKFTTSIYFLNHFLGSLEVQE